MGVYASPSVISFRPGAAGYPRIAPGLGVIYLAFNAKETPAFKPISKPTSKPACL
jgi:hypothetical protein